jgi:hypothetical protein
MRREFVPITEKTLGQILVERNIISPTQLQTALDRQKRQKGKYKYIGEILFEMGVSQKQINESLDIYGKRKPMGQIFLDLKILTPEQLQKALEKQNQLAKMAIRKPLGKLLIEMKYITYEEYLDVLSKHFNMPIVSLGGFFLSSSLQRAIGAAYAQKHQIVVLDDYAARIKLAFAEPNPLIMDEISRSFSREKRVEFYLANPSEVDSCLRKKFDPFSASHYR